MQHLLEKAILIALSAHKGQLDKGGSPYILHPLRVMFSLNTTEEKIVAVLHDVVEDSDITIDKLRQEGFSETTLEAVKLLTKSCNTSYMGYIQSIKNNPLAAAVKKADLNDNMNMTRIQELNTSDYERLEKYKTALSILNSK